MLCFPKPSEKEVESRMDELRSLNVSALEFSGRSSIYGVPLPVLGKGYVGVVVIAYLNEERVAIKIRRMDADRADLLHEAEMLRKANEVNVAPLLSAVSKNFLLMQFLEGELLPGWLKTDGKVDSVKQVLRSVLESCYRLDSIGLDHGELSKAPKHVIVDSRLKPWILDFESASNLRKTANLSAICHFLFTSSGETARMVAGILGERKRERIVYSLKVYRKHRTEETFSAVIDACLG